MPACCCCNADHRVAAFALWLNFVVFASAFPVILIADVEIKHFHMSTLVNQWQLLIAFGSIATVNGLAILSSWQEGGNAAVANARMALIANIVWNGIDVADSLWAEPRSSAALAPLPDLILCGLALWTLPLEERLSWMA